MFLNTIQTGSRKPLLLAAALFFVITATTAQESRITLSTRELTLRELFSEVEAQSGYLFAVNHSKIDVEQRIRLPRMDYPLEELLTRALRGTDQTYLLHGRHIILVSEEPAEAEPLPVVEEPVVRNKLDWAAVVDPDFSLWKASHSAYPVLYDPSASLSLSSFFDPVIPRAPRMAIKTNLLHGLLTLTPNLGVEVGLGSKTTFELHGAFNSWSKNRGTEKRRWTHWSLLSEFRYWPAERFTGHFFGVHAFYGEYNVGGLALPLLFDKAYRYDGGHALGGGLSYGYHWRWREHWGVEMLLGVGVAGLNYVKNDANRLAKERKTYLGPTRIGVSLYYLIH